jgi:hypothetical protein
MYPNLNQVYANTFFHRKSPKHLEIIDKFSIFALCLTSIRYQIGGLFAPIVIVRWRGHVFVIRFVCKFHRNISCGHAFFLTPSRMVSADFIERLKK